MSWFDSSFSFAKTALSQAQKSIDKVLDIKDGPDASKPHSDSGKKSFIGYELELCEGEVLFI